MTLEEVMKSKRSKYKRPEKPESESEAGSESESESEDEDEDGDGDITEEEDGDDNDEELKKKEKKRKKEKKERKGIENSQNGVTELVGVPLEPHEMAVWGDARMPELLPDLAFMDQSFKNEVLSYSAIVKGNSPHGVIAFWFYTNAIISQYGAEESGRSDRNAAISRFAARPRLWEMCTKQLTKNPDNWFRWQQLSKLEQIARNHFKKGKELDKGVKNRKGKVS